MASDRITTERTEASTDPLAVLRDYEDRINRRVIKSFDSPALPPANTVVSAES